MISKKTRKKEQNHRKTWYPEYIVVHLHTKKSVLWKLSKMRKNKELSLFLNRYLLPNAKR